ncbi:dihydropteroate synthase [Dechloromonas sp. XY25]|uniref:dihydropteroate synthase n=1 Tax=Dechloromonas hankyongensis TaxID=2908002 RepID=A0ABS9K0W3_9RHOO|nr:dihydropteroate synthase [Dechloromonas hankyongensis]MCG2576806.1 dihydropteroate synthase [Dechloromonas hankyongensis]
MTKLQCGQFRLALDRPLIMGIVNLTPDSFSGDGLVGSVDQAIRHAREQLEAGSDILDIGAESSRPGAIPTPEDEELCRLIPVLREITTWGVPVSVDTYKPVVMRAALEAGASMINDITGMTRPGALDAVAGSDCAVCVMHMQGEPGTMQQAPSYDDVVGEVRAFLTDMVHRCRAAGISNERLVLDPGFGFGKTLGHNLALFRVLSEWTAEALPLLVGVSRKSMLGAITGRPVEQRQAASVAAALMAAQKGAKILRVHDVAATRDALAVWAAIEQGDSK